MIIAIMFFCCIVHLSSMYYVLFEETFYGLNCYPIQEPHGLKDMTFLWVPFTAMLVPLYVWAH